MQNKKFLKISNTIQWFKDLFKKDEQWLSELSRLKDAVKMGDLAKFDKLFNGSNPYLNFNDFSIEALNANNIPLFCNIEEKAIRLKRAKAGGDKFEKIDITKKINDLFYDEIFAYAIIHDNDKIIKYLVQNNRIDVKNEFDNHAIFQMSKFEASKVLNYTLYDLNLPISDILMEKFQIYSNEEKHRNTIELISKRDFYFQLNGELDSSQQIQRSKPNKI